MVHRKQSEKQTEISEPSKINHLLNHSPHKNENACSSFWAELSKVVGLHQMCSWLQSSESTEDERKVTNYR